GNGPFSHFRAVRTLIPATAAAASCVLPSMRLCLSSLTCASVTIGPTPPRDGTLARAVRTAPTGKSSCRRPAKVIVADQRAAGQGLDVRGDGRASPGIGGRAVARRASAGPPPASRAHLLDAEHLPVLDLDDGQLGDVVGGLDGGAQLAGGSMIGAEADLVVQLAAVVIEDSALAEPDRGSSGDDDAVHANGHVALLVSLRAESDADTPMVFVAWYRPSRRRT